MGSAPGGAARHGLSARRPRRVVLAFIDQIVIPFLNSLYGAVGYLGVMIAMAIESAMIPLPSELILPYAGFLVSDPTQIEPLTHGPWSFWLVVIVATHRQHDRLADRLRDRGVGRPAVPRALWPVPADPAARDRARRAVLRAIRRRDGVLQPPPADRSDVHLVPGGRRPDAARASSSSTRRPGAFLWSIRSSLRAPVSAPDWEDIRHALQPFDLLVAVAAVVLVALFIWWRLGMPGRRRREA